MIRGARNDDRIALRTFQTVPWIIPQRLGRIDGPARARDDRSVNQLAAESPGVRGRPTLSRWNLSNSLPWERVFWP